MRAMWCCGKRQPRLQSVAVSTGAVLPTAACYGASARWLKHAGTSASRWAGVNCGCTWPWTIGSCNSNCNCKRSQVGVSTLRNVH